MNDEIVDAFVDGITQIGNNKKVMKACEPNVMLPLKLDKWMVYRTLTSLALFNKAIKEKKGKK